MSLPSLRPLGPENPRQSIKIACYRSLPPTNFVLCLHSALLDPMNPGTANNLTHCRILSPRPLGPNSSGQCIKIVCRRSLPLKKSALILLAALLDPMNPGTANNTTHRHSLHSSSESHLGTWLNCPNLATETERSFQSLSFAGRWQSLIEAGCGSVVCWEGEPRSRQGSSVCSKQTRKQTHPLSFTSVTLLAPSVGITLTWWGGSVVDFGSTKPRIPV